MANNVRMSVDGESCPGAMTRATPERHNGAAYTRVWLRFKCPHETGDFQVINEIPLDSVVDYELGGAQGTFLFDDDHTVMDASAPGFPRFIEKGVEHIVLGWDHVVFLVILLLGAQTLRDVLKLATVFTVAHSLTLALALLGVVNVPGAIVEPLIAASIVYVAAMQVLGIEIRQEAARRVRVRPAARARVRRRGDVPRRHADPQRADRLQPRHRARPGDDHRRRVPAAAVVRRFEWSQLVHAAAGSAAAAIGLFWLSQRVLGG